MAEGCGNDLRGESEQEVLAAPGTGSRGEQKQGSRDVVSMPVPPLWTPLLCKGRVRTGSGKGLEKEICFFF